MSAGASVLSSQIEEARKNGHSDEDILGYLSKSQADLAHKITEAQSNGYQPSEILHFVAKASKPSGPPPAMNKMPVPEGLKPEDQSITARALRNLPGSVASFVKNAPFAPSAGPRPIQNENGEWVMPPIDPLGEIGGVVSGLMDKVFNPGESFAEDPVGTVALPAMAAYGGYRGVTSPAVRAGVKEAASQVKADAKPIGKWGAGGAGLGSLVGYQLGSPILGGEVGGAVGSGVRAIPPALRGFRKGFGGYEPFLEKPMPPPPGTPAARFEPGQYDTKVADVPIEVQGATIPEYKGPVSGAPERTPTSDLELMGAKPAPTSGTPTLEQAARTNPDAAKILKQTAKNMGFKNFEDMPANVQATVLADIEEQGVPAATKEAPAAPAKPESVTFESPLPKSEQQRLLELAHSHRTTKNVAIAQYFREQNISPEAINKMSDSQYDSHVSQVASPLTGNKYKPSTGKYYSRDKAAARQQVMDLLRGASPTPLPLDVKPMPPK